MRAALEMPAGFTRTVIEDVPAGAAGPCTSWVLHRDPLDYATQTKDEPAPRLVLLHGLGDAPVTWFRCLAEALPGHELVLPALPGAGRGPLPEGRDGLSHDESRDWYLGLLGRLGLDPDEPKAHDAVHEAPAPPTVLAGHSLGGWLTNRVLKARPGLFDRLAGPHLLINPAGTAYRGVETERDKLSPAHIEDVQGLMADLYATPPPMPKAAYEALLATMQSPSYRSLLETPTKETFMLWEDLAAMPPGVGVIWGLADRLVDPVALATLKDHLPDPRVVELPGCGHAPHLECPAALRDALARLVTTI